MEGTNLPAVPRSTSSLLLSLSGTDNSLELLDWVTAGRLVPFMALRHTGPSGVLHGILCLMTCGAIWCCAVLMSSVLQ